MASIETSTVQIISHAKSTSLKLVSHLDFKCTSTIRYTLVDGIGENEHFVLMRHAFNLLKKITEFVIFSSPDLPALGQQDSVEEEAFISSIRVEHLN